MTPDTQTAITSRVSVSAAGTEGNVGGREPVAMSGDGRYVIFLSASNNLVAGTVPAGTTQVFRAPVR